MQLLLMLLIIACLFLPQRDPASKTERRLQRDLRRAQAEMEHIIKTNERAMLRAAQDAYWENRAWVERGWVDWRQ